MKKGGNTLENQNVIRRYMRAEFVKYRRKYKVTVDGRNLPMRPMDQANKLYLEKFKGSS